MSVKAGDLEGLVAGASGGWGSIEGAQNSVDERLKNNNKQGAQQSDDMRTIATAWKSFAASPEGEKALQALCNTTLNAPQFICHLGMATDQVAVHGAFREGQNDIVRAILRLIASGDDEQPKEKKKG